MRINRDLILRSAFAAYFLLPLFFLAIHFKLNWSFDYEEFYWAFKNSITQATWAAAVCILVALPMGLFLSSLKQKQFELLSRLLLLPQILPVVFSILIVFSILNPFPMGNKGIVIMFVVVNLGMSAVLIAQAIKTKCLRFAAVSEVFSLGKINFLFRVLIPIIKTDLLNAYFLVFAFCISSFSIPLIAGGGKGVNLEILIYEKIFIENSWSSALSLGVLQTVFVFFIGLLLTDKSYNPAFGKFENNYLKSYLGAFVIAVYLLFYIGGYLKGLADSLPYVEFLSRYTEEIISACLFSLKLLLIYSVVHFAVLFLWLKDYLNYKKFNPMLNLISLSTVVVGFAFYLTLPASKNWDVFKLVSAFGILSFVTLFKLFLEKPVTELKPQIFAAEVYGIDKNRIILQIIIKQISPSLSLWFFVSSIWFVSDYAVSKAVGLQTTSLGLMTESFISSYRLPVGFLLTFIIFIFVTIFTYTISRILRVLCR